MFYCDDCRETQGWPEGFFKSHGPCEVCGRKEICNEVPSPLLPGSSYQKVVTLKQYEDGEQGTKGEQQ